MSSGDWLVEDGGDILLPVPLGGGEHQQFVLNGLEGVGGDGGGVGDGGVGGGVGGGGGVSGGRLMGDSMSKFRKKGQRRNEAFF